MNFESDLTGACILQNWGRIKLLVERGMAVNCNEGEALWCASSLGRLDIVAFLVEQSVDIYAGNSKALRLAAQGGHAHVVHYLLEKGLDPNVDGGRPLILACMGGHLETVKCLLEHGADINQGSITGLEMAAGQGHLHVVRYLSEKGAKLDGALDASVIGGRMNVFQYLLSRGACFTKSNECDLLEGSIRCGFIPIIKFFERTNQVVSCEYISSCQHNYRTPFYSTNGIMYVTRRMKRADFRLEAQLKRLWDARMLVLVNLLKGTIHNKIRHQCGKRCRRGYSKYCDRDASKFTTWGQDPFYSPDMGMLVLSYVD